MILIKIQNSKHINSKKNSPPPGGGEFGLYQMTHDHGPRSGGIQIKLTYHTSVSSKSMRRGTGKAQPVLVLVVKAGEAGGETGGDRRQVARVEGRTKVASAEGIVVIQFGVRSIIVQGTATQTSHAHGDINARTLQFQRCSTNSLLDRGGERYQHTHQNLGGVGLRRNIKIIH